VLYHNFSNQSRKTKLYFFVATSKLFPNNDVVQNDVDQELGDRMKQQEKKMEEKKFKWGEGYC
jgi:hypothetical protein